MQKLYPDHKSDNPLKRFTFWSRKLARRAVQLAGSRLYINPDTALSKSILVTGAARSGTTWLGDLIAAQLPSRIMFEPFNPHLVKEYRQFQYFQYMRPEEENQALYDYSRSIFTGEIRNRWIDHKNEQFLPRYRVIKEIRANLILKWLQTRFPEVPILFLIRHPCAVVLSRMELQWATDSDIDPFLAQRNLVEDHLSQYHELIQNATSDEEKHAIIWCVSNLVPLRQFEHNELNLIYYENLCVHADRELPRVFEMIGQQYQPSARQRIDRPSMTTREASAIVRGTDKITRWQNILNASQVDRILGVVRAFGLNHLYGESSLPLAATQEASGER